MRDIKSISKAGLLCTAQYYKFSFNALSFKGIEDGHGPDYPACAGDAGCIVEYAHLKFDLTGTPEPEYSFSAVTVFTKGLPVISVNVIDTY